VAARRKARSSARATVLALPRRGGGELVRTLPSRRSVLGGLALFALAAAAFVAASQTSVFAVQAIEVRGAKPAVARQVLAALRPEVGVSLIRINADVLASRLGGVPWVASTTFDRSFPHTLVVTVRPERPVAVLRRGAGSWLVSARGRVLQQLPHGARPALPRIWVTGRTSLALGVTLGDADGGRAARALAPLSLVRFPVRVKTVQVGDGELTFVLRSGLELRLGDPSDLRLKLAIARRILRMLGPVAPGGYLDVSVAERPVASRNPQVGG
jgi:cell division protein FtsQ